MNISKSTFYEAKKPSVAVRLRHARGLAMSTRRSPFEDLERRVLDWLRERITIPGDVTTRDNLKAYAMRLHEADVKKATDEKTQAPKPFKASDGWATNFMRRHQVKTIHELHGERASSDAAAAEAFVAAFPSLLKGCGVSPAQVWNADESLGYYRIVPNRNALRFVSHPDAHGVKSDKSRVGMLLGVSAAGDMTRPLLCHNVLRPSQLTHQELDAAAHIQYFATHDGWVKSPALLRWLLTELIPKATETCRGLKCSNRALLLLDNASHHVTVFLMLMTDKDCEATIAGSAPGDPVLISAEDTSVPPFPTQAPKRPAKAAPRTPLRQKAAALIRAGGCDVKLNGFLLMVRWLPPNTTPLLQPCDAGLIACIKATWRSKQQKRLLDVKAPAATSVIRSITAVEYMKFIGEEVVKQREKPETLKAYWDVLFDRKPVPGKPLSEPPLEDGSVDGSDHDDDHGELIEEDDVELFAGRAEVAGTP